MSDTTQSPQKVSLKALFEQIPDPRSVHGKRHPLSAILTLTVTAMLAGEQSLTAYAEFGRNRPHLLSALGFTRDKSPCVATFSNTFRRLDVTVFERVVKEWLRANLGADIMDLIHIDGKVLRGSKLGDEPPAHLLSIYHGQSSAVLSQMPVEDTNEHKAALDLVCTLPLTNTILTGDAIFTQWDFAEKIGERGGRYILAVKNNQKEVLNAIKDGFEGRPFSPCGV
jgi:hypothetical protein